jgi:hypothetical protein
MTKNPVEEPSSFRRDGLIDVRSDPFHAVANLA